MRTLTDFFHTYWHRLLCSFVCLLQILLLLVAKPLNAQVATSDAVARVNELYAITPTLEDQLNQDEGHWSLKRGVSNVAFFDADGLHVRSHTTDEEKPYIMMTQSDLAAASFLVEVEAQHVKGTSFNGFGFYLMQPPAEYIFFYISNNGYVAIEHAALNDQEMLVPWQESSVIQTRSRAINQLGLLIEEGHATLFVNENEVASVDGLMLEGTTLGLVATSYEEAIVEIAFRNLRYWNLDDLSAPPATAPEQTAEDIAAQPAVAALTLDDMPDGFEPIPEKDVQTWLDESILDIFEEDGSVQVMNRFGFWHLDYFNFVVGASGSIITPIDEVMRFMAARVKRDPTVELIELEQVGDDSVAFAVTSTEEMDPARIEFLLFRRDQQIAMLMVGYPDGSKPIVELEELAELWDARLVASLEEAPVEIEEIDYLEEGKSLLDQGEWRQALEALTQAIEIDPENVEAYYYRGLAHYRLGAEDPDHYVMAIEDLTQAMESEDFFVQASTLRNKINQVADAEDLLAAYTEQIKNSEYPALAYAERGIVYRDRLGDYEKAIADLTQAIELATVHQRGDFYVERAFAYMEYGNAEASIEDATRAIEDEYTIDMCSAYAHRGTQYAELGEHEKAETDLNRARANCGDNPAILSFVSHHLGIMRYYKGETEDAISLFGDAIDYQAEAARDAAWESWESDFPSEPEENFEVVMAYFETLVAEHKLHAWREGELETEYAEYSSMLEAYDEVFADAARTYGWLGDIYRAQAEYDRAIENYTMAIEVDPTDTGIPYWYGQRGRSFYDQEHYENARTDLTTVVTLGRSDAPEVASAYNLLGLIASEEGNHREALAHYNMAIDIVPDNAIFYYNRAYTFYDLDDYESAIADFEMVLELTEDEELREEAEEWLNILEEQVADLQASINLWIPSLVHCI